MQLLFGQKVVSFDVGQETLEEVEAQEQHVLSARAPLNTHQTVMIMCVSAGECERAALWLVSGP